MNHLKNWWVIFFYFYSCFITPFSAFSQQEITVKGHTLDERGKPVGNVNVVIDKMRFTSTVNGLFQVYLKSGNVPTNVSASKEGLSIKDWKYDEANQVLNITMHAKQNLLRGEVRNRFNEHISNVFVTIKGITDNKPAKSNYDGKFSIVLPNDYQINNSTLFFIDGLPVENKDISFKDNNHYVILIKPKTPKEAEAAKKEEEGKVEDIKANIRLKKKEEVKKDNSVETEWNYTEDFKKINEDLAEQGRMVAESNEKLRNDLNVITDKLKTESNKSRRVSIGIEVDSLGKKLEQNKEVYLQSQKKTLEVITKLKQELLAKDSVTSATQEQLEELKVRSEQAEQKFQRNILIASSLIIFLLFLAIVFYFISRRIQKQNKQISYQTQELSNAYQEIKVQNDTLESQKKTLESQKSILEKQKVIIEKKNTNITASINYAQRIQRAMLPRQQDIQKLLPESFLFFKPKEIVSGDFYWIAEQDDEYGNKKIIIAAIDCTGHGVPGAFMSMVGDGLLNQIVKLQEITSPERILRELDKGIRDSLNQEQTENNDGMDIAICTIDKYNHTLEFAGAKNPLVYIQNGELKEIAGDKLHIGGRMRRAKEKLEDKYFTKHTINTSSPTYCYIFSDGYEDQFGGMENKKFSKRQLHSLLLSNYKQPIEEQKYILEKNIGEWTGLHTQIDDILVIGFKI
jgi:serine phosphatase RsbU (regulator of sigma subunit)